MSWRRLEEVAGAAFPLNEDGVAALRHIERDGKGLLHQR